MRVEQRQGKRGSLKWIQGAVATPGILDHALRGVIGLPTEAAIDWRSPRAEDGWAEYRDRDFLRVLDLDQLVSALDAFWPRRGPQWDGLARATSGEVILIEAKSHATELTSSCGASPESRARIELALNAAKHALGADPEADWLSPYYQYANRLAHLHFLRDVGVPAHLVFVYFLNDRGMNGPATRDAWLPTIADAHAALGLHHGLPAGAHEVFIDVSVLRG
jgi:hypothetical protein